MDDSEVANCSPIQLRISHAEYFLEQYNSHSSSYWLMIAYFDAFTFAVASLKELAKGSDKAFLDNSLIFQFFIAMRNISAHHSIPAARSVGSKFPRAFDRAIGQNGGTSALIFKFDALEAIFRNVTSEFPKATKNLKAALAHVESVRDSGRVGLLQSQMNECLASLRAGLKV